MIERLRNEDMLRKIDTSSLSNYHYIKDDYKGLFFDVNNEYTVPYNVGMVGIIYNSALIGEPEHSWAALWDEKYQNMSLNFNNPRDGFMTAQKLLGYSVNSTNLNEWNKAYEKLKQGALQMGLSVNQFLNLMYVRAGEEFANEVESRK
jgi:spermidine/putrescine-binding protein